MLVKTKWDRDFDISLSTIVISFLVIILFDGIFRLLADLYRLRILNAWKDLLILLILYLLTFYIVFIRRKLLLRQWDIIFFFFSISTIPTAIYFHGLVQTIWGIKIFIIPVLFYILLFNLFILESPSWEMLRKFILVNLIVYIPIFSYALLQYLTKFEFLRWLSISPWDISYIKITFIEKTVRAIGTFRHQFNFGNYSAFIAIFAFEGILLSRKLLSKIAFLFIFLIAFTGVFISTSRSSLLITVHMLVTLTLLTYFRQYKKFIKMFLIVLSVALPIMIIYIALFKLGTGRQKFFMFSTLSTVTRLFVWSHAITHFPFYSSPVTLLFGYGVGSIGGAQALVGDPNWNPVDNIFLYFLINFGVVGTLLILYLLLKPVFSYINQIDKIPPNWLDVMVGMTLAIVFAEGMFATFFDGFPLPYIFWFLHFYFRIKSSELIEEIQI